MNPTASDVISAIAQKRTFSASSEGKSDTFLFDIRRGATLDSSEPIAPGQQLRLVFTSSDADSASMTDDIFETSDLEIGSLYVGSVTTGTRGLSPLRKKLI